MSKPKISIIVPIYNVEKYIYRCVNSLINQTLKDIEIILVNDGSEDNCGNVCELYAKKDSRIRVIHKKNEGLGFARNSGMEIARGNYIGFVDSDDCVSNNMFEILLREAEKENYDMILSGYTRVKSDGKKINYNGYGVEQIYNKENRFNLLIDMIGTNPEDYKDMKCNMSVWKCIYSRDFLEKNNIKFPSEREFISEDLIFHIDVISKSEKIKFIPECLYYHYDNSNSLTTSYNSNRLDKNISLCREVKRKLNLIYNKDVSIFINRLLLSRIKTIIIQIIKYNKFSYHEKIKELSKIRNYEEVNELLNTYPINNMVIKQKIFYLIFKNKLFNILILLVNVNRR